MTSHENKTALERKSIIKIGELRKLTALSPSWIYYLMKQDLFPKNFKLVPGGRASGWYLDEVEHWLSTRREEGANHDSK